MRRLVATIILAIIAIAIAGCDSSSHHVGHGPGSNSCGKGLGADHPESGGALLLEEESQLSALRENHQVVLTVTIQVGHCRVQDRRPYRNLDGSESGLLGGTAGDHQEKKKQPLV